VANLKTRPFKKVYCDRPEVFLLPPAAFKVWMYHYIREGTVRESWPSLPTICEKLNMNEETVKKARKWLKDNGWLKQVGSKTSKDSGKFKVPVMQVIRGTIPPKVEKPPVVLKGLPGRKTRLRVGAEKPPTDGGGKTAAEVEPVLQVDTERQVDGFADCLFNAKESTALKSVEAGAWHTPNVPEAEKPPTVVIPAGQLVTSLPHDEGMKWWRKCDQGTTYEQHRAEIEAAVIEYQKTQEVTQ
jgi:hypothetical protein